MKEKKHNMIISPVMRVHSALVKLANSNGIGIKQQAVAFIEDGLIRKGYLKQK